MRQLEVIFHLMLIMFPSICSFRSAVSTLRHRSKPAFGILLNGIVSSTQHFSTSTTGSSRRHRSSNDYSRRNINNKGNILSTPKIKDADQRNSSNLKHLPKNIDSSSMEVKTSYSKVAILQAGKGALFKGGNPIIYNGAIQEIRGNPIDGDDIYVVDHRGNVVGRGFFNSKSMYKVRLLARGYEKLLDLPLETIILKRLQQAIDLRKSINLPSDSTNAFRLVNSEGDQLSGLIVDVYNNVATIQSSAMWVEKNSEIIRNSLKSSLQFSDDQIIWKRAEARLIQDGIDIIKAEANEADSMSVNSQASLTVVRENDISFRIDVEGDQKTGFYCDQRDNRLMIRKLARGKRVLDAYCYTGGFTLNALLGGALSVVSVDSSAKAVSTLHHNLRLNNEERVNDVKTIEGDCIVAMQAMISEGKQFDLVICDPPKLAPNRLQLEKAKPKYLQVNALAMQLVAPDGGLLLTCSCSAAMTQSGEFVKMLKDAAGIAKRRITIVNESGAAMDHTIAPGCPESKYLTAVLLFVQ
jgi:23S rRNA G2069 N7-methylase RlmK/C1962 C5-methylase RlmI